MPTVLIPLAEGCEEIEAITLIDLLRRAEIQVVTASLTTSLLITASRGVQLMADTMLDNVICDELDMLILPGGQPGTRHLNSDPRIHALINYMSDQNKWIGAICAAPLVLAHTGVLNGLKVSCYPGALEPSQWPQLQLSHDAVVCDNKIITSRGPGTAMEFALTVIDKLMGATISQRIAAELVIS